MKRSIASGLVISLLFLTACSPSRLLSGDASQQEENLEMSEQEAVMEPSVDEATDAESLVSVEEIADTEEVVEAVNEVIPVRVEALEFERVDATQLQLVWTEPVMPEGYQDCQIQSYQIMRRSCEEGRLQEWEAVGEVSAQEDSMVDMSYQWLDTLPSAELQQYEYRVDLVLDTDAVAMNGKGIMASNVLVCIDPGHYAGVNYIPESAGTAYAEGDFTILVAQNLRQILKEDYGISAYMTRENGSITLSGYSDVALDQGHISLRGEYASGSDMFISIHTNANRENANGYPTFQQPIGIVKPVVLINTVGMNTPYTVRIANGIGTELAMTEYELGVSEQSTFKTVTSLEDMTEWTDEYNDSTTNQGTVCYRFGDSGDYYGVLRGASVVNTPGIIVEHGFHTNEEFRQKAATGEFDEMLAEADARGIADGLSFIKGE